MKLSLIFPVKNQSEKLIKNLEDSGLSYFDSLGITYEAIIVNDHSSAEESKLLAKAAKKMPLQIRLVENTNKPGKGFAVKKGIEEASGTHCLFMDADLATDLSAMKLILPEIESYDAFMASRDLKDSKVYPKQTLSRQIFHKLSRLIIHLKFHFKQIKDTQCGFKCFRTDLAKKMAEKQIINAFAFDVEYCYFLELNGFKIKEFPAIWRNDFDSTVKALGASKIFYQDLKRIKKNKKNYILSEEERKALC